MLFRSCAARCLRAGDVGAAVDDVDDAIGQRVWLFPREQRRGRELGLVAFREARARVP